MKFLGIVFFGFVGTGALAANLEAPPDFGVGGGTAIFVDFNRAEYQLIFDAQAKKAYAQSFIEFDTTKDGFPLFDLVPNPSKVILDGEEVGSNLVKTEDGATQLRVVTREIPPGRHLLRVQHTLSDGVLFSEAGVSAGFWFNDLKDREFLELFLPTNLEYDTYAMKWLVQVVGVDAEEFVWSNGSVRELGFNSWQIDFPKSSNTSSPFFHMGPRESFELLKATHHSVSDRDIPILIYKKADSGADLEAFMEVAKKTLVELEADYGAYAHPSLLIYASPSFPGGMEYRGATITNLHALSHEITHSYFGRAMMPANGNAGWIDEAIASWRDQHYPKHDHPKYGAANLAGQSDYRRWTTGKAYYQGMSFMAYVDSIFSGHQLSLKTFLKELFHDWSFQPLTTGGLESALESFSSLDLAADFKEFVYGEGEAAVAEDLQMRNDPRNPMHPRLSREALRKFY